MFRGRDYETSTPNPRRQTEKMVASVHLAVDKEDLALIEEIKDFALEDIALEVVILYRSEASTVGGSIERDEFGPNVMCL